MMLLYFLNIKAKTPTEPVTPKEEPVRTPEEEPVKSEEETAAPVEEAPASENANDKGEFEAFEDVPAPSREIPENGTSIQDRIAQGGEPLPHVRQNPDGYYYDPSAGRYKARSEPSLDFPTGNQE